MNAREQILARLRQALDGAPARPEPAPDRLRATPQGDAAALADPADLAELLVDRLVDYRATVHRGDSVAALTVACLAGAGSVVVPQGVPDGWLDGYGGRVLTEPLTVTDLDQADAVLTGCAVAIAETGTIVLDAGPAQGRRALTLIPDHHVCVVRADQIVGTVPEAVELLDPRRALTWISGPSATSDIELKRVEGVHGPRRLDVILLPPALSQGVR